MSRFSSLSQSIALFFSPCLLALSSVYTFLLSNPIYFAYFLLFSPYLLRLLSFLFPLLLCISLLLFCFPSFENQLPQNEAPEEEDMIIHVLQSSFGIHSLCSQVQFSELYSPELIKPTEVIPTVGKDDSKGTDGCKLHDYVCVSKEIDPNSLENWRRPAVLSPESKDALAGEKGFEAYQRSEVGFFSHELLSKSMRKEKEWKRTLACKLYEERRSTAEEGGEGMDLLWEVHEVDSSGKAGNKAVKSSRRPEKAAQKAAKEEEEDEETSTQLCCLQALKFTTGKMNLGLGRPTILQLSKRLKGMRLLAKKDRRVS